MPIIYKIRAVRMLSVLGLALGLLGIRTSEAATEGRPCPTTARAPQSLVQVTSDARPGKTYILGAVLDEQGDLSLLQYEGSRLGTVCFTMDDLRAGVIIMKQEDREVIRLRTCAGFSAHAGGGVQLEYLHDGITGSYRQYPMSLDRHGAWTLSHDRIDFNQLHFLKRKNFLGITVGVQAPVPIWR